MDEIFENNISINESGDIITKITILDSDQNSDIIEMKIINETTNKQTNNTKIVNGVYDAQIELQNGPIEKIEFNNLNISGDTKIGIDDVSETGNNSNWEQIYAIDPAQLQFDNATVTAVATGTELYKCKDWNFTEQRCFGSWEKIMDIIPGQEYNFLLTTDDPGYGEDISSIVYDNNSSAAGTGALSFSHTILDEDNRILIVGAEAESDGAGTATNRCRATSVKYGTTNLTKIDGIDLDAGADNCVSLWYLLSPSIGTANINITFAGAITESDAGAISLHNVKQQAPEATNKSYALSSPTSINTSIKTLTNGAWVVDVIGSGAIDVFIPLQNNTKRWDIGISNSQGAGSTKLVSAAGTTKMGWGIDTLRLVHVLAAFAPWGTNSVPTHTTPILNSTDGSNNTDQNLTCYNQSTYDADSHPVKNIFNWKKNGTSIAVLNMPFEGGSNSTWTEDYSGFGNNGTVSGATYNATGGYDGKGAYVFNGINTYIKTNNSGSLNISREVSVAAWIKIKNWQAGLHSRIVVKPHSIQAAPWNAYGLTLTYTQKIQFEVGRNDSTNVNAYSDYTFEYDRWIFIVGTYNGSQSRIYINGVLNGTSSGDFSYIMPTNQSVYIGTNPHTTNESFNGTIDDVKVYNFTLTPDQILALYQNKTNIIVSNETSVGDIWQACITPNDGIGDGDTLCSNNLTILQLINNPPNVTLSYPADNYVNSTSQYVNITFNASVTDDYNIKNCSLWHNITGTWARNQSQNVTGTANVTAFNLTNLINKTFIWNIQCYDNASQASFASANRTVKLNWTDITPPAWNPLPSDQTIEYGTAFSYDANATDMQAITYSINDTTNFQINSATGLITNKTSLMLRTYSLRINATDTSSNINSTTITITVQDTTKPKWNPLPSSQTSEYGSSFSYDANATDMQIINYSINDTTNFQINSATGVITNKTSLAIKIYSLQINATDASSNINSTAITITIQDTTKPKWNPLPSNQILDYGSSFSYDANATDLQIITYSINDTTNFAINSITGLITNNTLLTIRTYGLQINATDASSNVNSTTIMVTVQDITPPAWSPLPSSLYAEYGSSFSYDANATDMQAITYSISDTSLFDINPSTGVIINLAYPDIGEYLLNITATDASGNANITAITIIVQDTTPPAWDVLPANQTIEYGTAFSYDIGATDLQTITYSIDDTANFAINPSTGLITNNTFLPVGTYLLQINATDTSNNINTSTITVTVQDTTRPAWNPTPTSQDNHYGNEFNYTVNAQDLSGIDSYFIDDTINFSINFTTGNIKNNTLLAVGAYSLNVSVNDTHGNILSKIIIIHVLDVGYPEWDTNPQDQLARYGYDFVYDLNATDDVGIDSYSINDTTNFAIQFSTGIITNNTLLSVGQYPLTVAVNDTSGNTNTRTITITVSDLDNPQWVIVPSGQTEELGNSFSYQLNATDNVAIDSYSIDDKTHFEINPLTGLITNKTYLAVGNYSLQATVNDTAGNENSSGIIIIIIIDTKPPVWNPLPPQQVPKEYGVGCNYDANATDLQTVLYSMDNMQIFKINSFTGLITNKITIPIGNHTINLNATDASGNVNSTSILLIVQDTIAPSWNPLPTDQTAEYGTAFSYDTGATDLQTITYSINDTTNFQINSATGLITNKTSLTLRTYSLRVNATDVSSNVNSTTITITAQDTTPPAWSQALSDQLVEYNNSFSYDVNATDLQSITYMLNDTTNFAINTGTGMIANNLPLSVGNYSIRITATDHSSNVLSSDITITIQDTTPPAWNPLPSSQTVKYNTSFSYDVNATDLQSITYSIDDTTNFAVDSGSGLITNSTLLPVGAYSLTVTATDASNNLNYSVINITVQESNSPVISSTAPTNQSSLSSGTTFYLIQLITDEQAVCRYSSSNVNWSSMTQMSTTNSTTHLQMITGLSDGNTYNYYFICEDVNTLPNRMESGYYITFSVSSPSTPSTPPSSSGNSGGGGGGGGGRFVKTCNESWTCGEWNDCNNGLKARICVDINNCNTTKDKPKEADICSQESGAISGEVQNTYGDIMLEDKISTDMPENRTIYFYYNGNMYSLQNTGVKGDGAEFMISSEEHAEQRIKIETLETNDIDLDGDGTDDISITLKSIERGIPRIIIKPLKEKGAINKITGKAISVKPEAVYKVPPYTFPLLLLILAAAILVWIRKSNLERKVKNILTGAHISVSGILIVFASNYQPETGITGLFMSDFGIPNVSAAGYLRLLFGIIILIILFMLIASDYKGKYKGKIRLIIEKITHSRQSTERDKFTALKRAIQPLSEINKEIMKHVTEEKVDTTKMDTAKESDDAKESYDAKNNGGAQNVQ